MWRNTKTRYGRVSKIIHWLTAMTIIALFALGYWMVGLDYYSEWYKTAPDIHRSVGILVVMLTMFRLIWKHFEVSPEPLGNPKKSERLAVTAVHYLFYVLIIFIGISGYLISTADDRAVAVFNWFELPSIGQVIDDQEDIAGLLHEYAAYTVIGLAILHALAALKHHFINRDETLKRML